MLNIVDCPDSLLINDYDVDPYPNHQKSPMIEPRALEHFISRPYHDMPEIRARIDTGLAYLPIQWTAIYRKYGVSKQNTESIQMYINQVVHENPKTRFFTITQWAGGPQVDIPGGIVFTAGGCFGDYMKNVSFQAIPIPLVCDDHGILPLGNEVPYKASFVGRMMGENTPLRHALFETFHNKPGYHLEESRPIQDPTGEKFAKIMENSLFVFCPRGYGPTSFRLFETIRAGRIPIYVSDNLVLPFREEINWNQLAILCRPDEVSSLPRVIDELIDSGEYTKLLTYGKFVKDRYFSYDGVIATIERMLTSWPKNCKPVSPSYGNFNKHVKRLIYEMDHTDFTAH